MGINIGFDADGVIFDTEAYQLSSEVKKFVKNKYDLEIINENGYGIKDVYGCDEKIEIDIWTRFLFDYSLKFCPRLWMKETIAKLRSEGNKVFIITSKACALEKNYKGIIVRFLFEIGLKMQGINVDGIEYCSLKNSGEDKLRVCRQKKISVMVEDKWENIEKISTELFVLCMDSKNNKKKDFNQNVYRVYDANDVYFHICRIKGLVSDTVDTINKYQLKSKDEKQCMDIKNRKIYYTWLKEYYRLLPFNSKYLNSSEKFIRCFAKIFSIYFWCKYHPIIIGKENLTNEKGVIYICNHLCDKDMLLLLYAFHDSVTQWHPLIKREILDEKVGVLFEKAYSVFVNRSSPKDRHIATQELAKLLVHGYNVLVFPEGTYNKTKNNLKNFEGVSHVYLSSVLGKRIVPCALTDNYYTRPILRIGQAFTISDGMSLEDAVKESYLELDCLVEKNRQYMRTGKKSNAGNKKKL